MDICMIRNEFREVRFTTERLFRDEVSKTHVLGFAIDFVLYQKEAPLLMKYHENRQNLKNSILE